MAGTRSSLSSQAHRANAYEQIKQAILAGELSPGEMLREIQLAEWCGVSRTPVREALQRLEQDGLVTSSRHGLIVRRRSPEEILDLYEVRIVLEGTAARVAAGRRTDHDLRQLRWALAADETVPADDLAQMVDVNKQFNRLVWTASHNESLGDLLDRLLLHLGRFPQTTLARPGRWAQNCAYHRDVAAAIERRDSKTAQALAESHFSAARDIRLDLFAQEVTDF